MLYRCCMSKMQPMYVILSTYIFAHCLEFIDRSGHELNEQMNDREKQVVILYYNNKPGQER